MLSTVMNLVDLLLVILLIFFVVHGYRKGAVTVLFEMSGLIFGLLAAVVSYGPVGRALSIGFGLSLPLAKPLSFLAVWTAVEILTPLAIGHLCARLPTSWLKSAWNRPFGLLLAAVAGLILSAFVLSLIVSFQFPSVVKQRIFHSEFGSVLVRLAQSVEALGNRLTDRSGNYQTLSFTTVSDGEIATVALWSSTEETFPDTVAEEELFGLINDLQQASGLPPLVIDRSLVTAARMHGEDLFGRGYLSSLTPEGQAPSDRAERTGVSFIRLTERLAHAPEVGLAFRGLSRSGGWRQEILSMEYGRVGIGVINAGSRGSIFILEFAD